MTPASPARSIRDSSLCPPNFPFESLVSLCDTLLPDTVPSFVQEVSCSAPIAAKRLLTTRCSVTIAAARLREENAAAPLEEVAASPASGRERTAWEDREAQGFFKGLFGTLNEALFRPTRVLPEDAGHRRPDGPAALRADPGHGRHSCSLTFGRSLRTEACRE